MTTIADTYIDLNGNFTTGTPTVNSGIRVTRGSLPSSQLRWNESTKKWEITSDGATFANILTATDLSNKITSLNGDITGSGTNAISTVLSETGVISGLYGSTSTIPQITIDAKGRISDASNVPLSLQSTQIPDFSTSVRSQFSATAGIQYNSTTGSFTVDSTIATKSYADAASQTALNTAKAYADSLNVPTASGLTAGIYGGASGIPSIVVNSSGKITEISTLSWAQSVDYTSALIAAITPVVTAAVSQNSSSSLNLTGVGAINSGTYVSTTTAQNQILDVNLKTSCRSVKYQIQIASGTTYQTTELMLVHDGSTVTMIEYGNISTGQDLADYDADISGVNVRLLVSPVNANTAFKFIKSIIS